jgi:hypothetical protein
MRQVDSIMVDFAASIFQSLTRFAEFPGNTDFS